MMGSSIVVVVILGAILVLIGLVLALIVFVGLGLGTAVAIEKSPRKKKRVQGYYTCPYCPASFASPRVICPRCKSRTDPPSIFPPSNQQ